MLTYLFLASRQNLQVDSYRDEAVGFMTKNDRGALWISEVVLHPRIVYGGENIPGAADEDRLHHLSHEQCFIANSIRTRVSIGK